MSAAVMTYNQLGYSNCTYVTAIMMKLSHKHEGKWENKTKDGDSRKRTKIKGRKWRVGMKGGRRRDGIWFVTASSGIFVLSDRLSDTIVRAWQLRSPSDVQHRSRKHCSRILIRPRHLVNKKCLITDNSSQVIRYLPRNCPIYCVFWKYKKSAILHKTKAA